MYCSTPVLKAQACWNTSPIIVLHYSLFQAAFSDTVTSASAPPNSSRFKNDAGIFYRFYCESRANRESCHHSVFPFQRQMNALLPRDQATLPKACLGSLLGPMFARRVLLLALWPLGKLEATLLETSDNRIQQGHFNHASGAPHFLPPPMSPCQHRKRRLGLAVPPSKTFARPTSTRSISILCFPRLHVSDCGYLVGSSTWKICAFQGAVPLHLMAGTNAQTSWRNWKKAPNWSPLYCNYKIYIQNSKKRLSNTTSVSHGTFLLLVLCDVRWDCWSIGAIGSVGSLPMFATGGYSNSCINLCIEAKLYLLLPCQHCKNITAEICDVVCASLSAVGWICEVMSWN